MTDHSISASARYNVAHNTMTNIMPDKYGRIVYQIIEVSGIPVSKRCYSREDLEQCVQIMLNRDLVAAKLAAVKAMLVPLPPIEEQRQGPIARIAAAVDRVYFYEYDNREIRTTGENL